MSFLVRPMEPRDLAAVVALQPLAFPPPFDPDYHWDVSSLTTHLRVFPEGQFVAEVGDAVLGSCINVIIPESRWREGRTWIGMAGSPDMTDHDPRGTTLFGMDIAVHPAHRRRGIGRAFYAARYDLVRRLGLVRFGTGTRMPDYAAVADDLDAEAYARAVERGERTDRTLTPLLKMGPRLVNVLPGFMPDPESRDWGAILEWRPA